jgi:hypothetical protein
MGHGRLRRYTLGSRLIVEALLMAFWVAVYFAASFLDFAPSTSVAVIAILVVVLGALVVLDSSVLRYRCSTCGEAFTRRELSRSHRQGP